MWPSRLVRRGPSNLLSDYGSERLNSNRTALNRILDLSVGDLDDRIR